jgi:glutamyl/glutaminyl-tRNA synthetase
MANTRFSPTLNGSMHLGHLFSLLVNEYIAHTTEGKFYVRFDDENFLIQNYSPKRINYIRQSYIQDIEWFGFKVDGWIKQSDIIKDVTKTIYDLGYDLSPDENTIDYIVPLSVRMGMEWVAFPYVPQQTAERVVMDNMSNITDVIRGDDFLTEYSLYYYFCDKFKLPKPKLAFIPRLCSIRGDISKKAGGYKISELRSDGYAPEEIIYMMIKACLYYPENGWELYNIKRNPQLSI